MQIDILAIGGTKWQTNITMTKTSKDGVLELELSILEETRVEARDTNDQETEAKAISWDLNPTSAGYPILACWLAAKNFVKFYFISFNIVIEKSWKKMER